jgi:hypothetical protein
MPAVSRAYLPIALLLGLAGPARAGVTIHYQGHARSKAAVGQLLATARAEAERNGWRVEDVSQARGTLTRMIGEKERTFQGPIQGIVIHPHDLCEPLYLQFGADLYFQDFVKTQFAGAEVHVQIVQLFRKLRRYLADLSVEDEGEYWRGSDRAKLEGHIAFTNAIIEKMRAESPTARGPVKVAGGRIIDLMK